MKRSVGIIWLAGLLAAAIALGGCARGGGETKLPMGDELVLAIGSESEDGYDPTRGWGRYGSPLFQSTLLKRGEDMSIGYDLATGYEVSGDGLLWTVDIRDDVVFSDGEPLTAEDVRYTFEQAASSGSMLDLTNLRQVEAGDNRVLFHLHKPQSTFLHYLITLGIVPKHAHSEQYAQQPIGSGPFKLVQWDRGQQLIVEANPLYYGEQPAFRKLTFLFLSEDAAFAAAKAGEVHMSYVPAAFSQGRVDGMNLVEMRTVDNRGIVFPYVESGGMTDAGHPVGNDVTADPAIRKAINYVLDRHKLVEGILEGYGSPAYSSVDGLPWWNPDTIFPDGDVDKAKRLLAEAGWQDSDQDGIVEKDGLKAEFDLLYPASDVTRQSLALAAAEMTLAAGIRMNPQGRSWDEIGREMHANAVLFGWGSHDPLELYSLHNSRYAGVDYYNTGYYSNAAVDEWMERAMEATDDNEASLYWQKAQWDGETGLSVLGDAPWAWLVNIHHLYLVDERLDIGEPGIQPHGHGWPVTDNIASWKWKS